MPNKSSAAYWPGKAVVVTGGARGQGAAEVLHLLAAGATVLAVDIHPADSEHWADLVAAAGTDRLVTIVADISTEAGWQLVADAVESTGVPVNNAGVTLRKTVTQTTPEEWNRLMGVNLNGAYLGTRALAPLLRDGGAIVNISSVAGLTGYFSAAYCTSKYGLLGLTKATAIELAPRNIRANSVCPGLVETPMIHTANAVHGTETAVKFHDANQAATPLDGGADPAEFATVVAFLLGPDASFINAADVPVDGGMIGGGIYWQVGRSSGLL
ncbi:SDR family oxidoreductase [Micrococcales bacterium 31B]|nr:SDR family oxidoreductase [Micrococcales bacterium 31B]